VAGPFPAKFEELFLKKNLLIFFLGVAVIIALDQITKSMITTRFVLHEAYPVIPGFLNLVYVMNPGAAFGFLANASETFRHVFFTGITVLATGLIVYYLVKSNPRNLLLAGSLTLIFGGAVGNLIDRIRFGAVVDFLDVYIGGAHWPAFNVADSAITVGAILMIWELILNRKNRQAAT
jgi:signal peptidase II